MTEPPVWHRFVARFPPAHRVVIIDGRIVYASLIGLDFLTKRLPPPRPTKEPPP